MKEFVRSRGCVRCASNAAPGMETFTYEAPPAFDAADVVPRVWVWNISLAKAIVRKIPRETVPLPANFPGPAPDFDPGHLDHVDTSEPAIITPFRLDGFDAWLLLDGIHRVQRAVRDGVAEVPAVTLERWEQIVCMVVIPGSTIDRVGQSEEIRANIESLEGAALLDYYGRLKGGVYRFFGGLKDLQAVAGSFGL